MSMKLTYEQLEQQLAVAISERDAAVKAELVWEKSMMEACGEDGPASVAAEIAALRAQRDTALESLRQQLAAVVAENAGLKAGEKFFMYSDDSGFETYKTQEEAIKAAQEMIDDCREDAHDGWPEEADTIRWGLVIQQATETDFKKPAPENGWEGSSDYKLLPETPATDAYLAEVRAQGVDAAIEKLIQKFEGTGHIGVPVMVLESFAAQLRQGGAQ